MKYLAEVHGRPRFSAEGIWGEDGRTLASLMNLLIMLARSTGVLSLRISVPTHKPHCASASAKRRNKQN